MENESWTPLRIIQWTTEFFRKRGIEDARLDAELLLAHALEMERIMLYARFDKVLTEEELGRYRESVRERAAGRPAKYIIGRTEFYSLPFQVDERVLIPRPETELLVERALAYLKGLPSQVIPIVVDVGAGSGAVAVALAKNYREARYLATEASAAALQVARENAEANGVGGAVEFLEGDLLAPLRPLGIERQVNLIVSNPPYVSEAEYATLAREIREYEPAQALIAGPLGTEVHERLLGQAAEFLTAGGALLMEMDDRQKDSLEELAERSGQYDKARFHQDYARLWRVMEVKRREA